MINFDSKINQIRSLFFWQKTFSIEKSRSMDDQNCDSCIRERITELQIHKPDVNKIILNPENTLARQILPKCFAENLLYYYTKCPLIWWCSVVVSMSFCKNT